MRRILLALVVLFPISSNAWAWGDEGHKVICEIAFRLSQPNTRAEIRKLIATDEQFNTFSEFLHVAGSPAAKGNRAFREPAKRFGWAPLRDLPRRGGVCRDGDQEGL